MALLYEKAIAFEGDPATALAAVRDIFIYLNFALKQSDSTGFEITGPGMSSTKQNPLVGISHAWVLIARNELRIRAELGGVRKMQYFVMLFPAALVFSLCVLFHFALPNGDLWVKSSAPALLLTWMIVGLVMGIWMQRRSTRAIDVALENAAMLATRRPPSL